MRRFILNGVLASLLASSFAQGAGWQDERVVGPVICRADFSLAGYEGMFQDLAAVQRDLSNTLDVPAATEPIEFYLFHDKATFHGYMKKRYPQVPVRRALYIKANGSGRVFVYRHDELAIDVRHEGTHALLHAVLPMVPLWLDEGLAEYFEVTPDARAYDNPHLSALRWDLRLQNVPRIRTLEAKKDLKDMDAGDYRQAWAWVHFMMHGPTEAHDELVAYLSDIRSSVPPGKLSDRLERRLPEIERRLVQHFKTWKR